MNLVGTAVVVGTGIAGASCAYALARRGVRVTTVDGGNAGSATQASAGIIQPWSSATPDGDWFDLYAYGGRYYRMLLERLADDGVDSSTIGYSKTGALVVSRDPSVMQQAEERVRRRLIRWPEAGEVAVVDSAQARDLFPPLSHDLTAVHISGGAQVDGRRLRQGLLDAASRHQAVHRSGTATVEKNAGGAARIRVEGEVVDADAVVLAAGAWTDALTDALTDARPVGMSVVPQRGQIVHLRIPGVDSSHWPSVHPETGHYMVCFSDSRIAVGATRETGSGYDPRVTIGGQLEVLRAALDIAPGLSGATYLETRVGLRPMSHDNRPVIGAVPGNPGLYVCTGFGPSGLTLGPYVGEAVADLVLGAALPPPVVPFAPRG